MVLKKQTVWLLTMLSLIVVLSVYYITTPGQSPNQMAVGDKKSQQNQAATSNKGTASKSVTDNKKSSVASSVSSDNMFTAYRIDRDNNRSKEIAKWQEIAASKDSTAVQASKALDSIHQLQTLASNETLLEDMIKAKGFKDALVETQGNNVHVYVKAKSLSNSQAVTIMNLTKEYFGNKIVSVSYD